MAPALRLPRGRSLDLGAGPFVMGVVNCTPDSFFPASRAAGAEEAFAAALAMIAQGADIIDLGGESTRPGSDYVEEGEEMKRVLPVVARLRAATAVPISVDTRKRAVAEEALAAGADMINDVSALEDDPAMAGAIAGAHAAVVLMHKRGEPKTMQEAPAYGDPVAEIASYLRARAEAAQEAGIGRESIVLDPGMGFGKRLEDNLDILKRLAQIAALGYPVLVGLSRKSFLGTVTGRDAAGRLAATTAANAIAMVAGADIIRVHDAAAARDAASLVRALRARP
jgi:dihydropteroate synthase